MTENALVPVVEVDPRVQLGVIRADGPAQLVRVATEAADALRDVISRKKLFSNIQGKEYVKVEGWTTLAAMMGCLPREVSVNRDEKGTYTATVELVRMGDQAVLTRASAECGMDEKTWASRADYARRSMAVTRATSKASRIAFSWVMVLAGYQATPAEEIPHDDVPAQPAKAPRKTPPASPVQTEPLTERPAAIVAAEKEPAPWEADQPLKWKNKPLTEFATPDLVALRGFCEKKDPEKYSAYLTQIEEILASRQGE